MWVIIASEPGLWTVGFYRPDSSWVAHAAFASLQLAEERVHFLNGGG